MSQLTDTLPPSSQEAERIVLGSMIRHNALAGDVLQLVGRQDFYLDAHQKVFDATVCLYDRGQAVDLPALAELLRERKQIEDVGGYGYLGELWEAAPTGANAAYYASIVRDKAVLRSLIRLGLEMARDAQEQAAPAAELLEAAERGIFAVAQNRLTDRLLPLSTVLDRTQARIDQRILQRGGGSGLQTGLVELDDKLIGLQNSELIVIGARPSCGKTALGLALAKHACLENQCAAYFASMEQPHEDLGERLLCAEADIDSFNLRRGCLSDDETGRLLAASDQLRGLRLFIDDSNPQSMLRIAANARRLKLQHGIKLVVVDYLQLIEADGRRDTRQEQVSGISRRLKQLARELQIPVVALCQLNRAAEDRAAQRPRLADLRESGGIEQDADTVLLLYPLEDPATTTEEVLKIGLIIAKQRNGPTGEIVLGFRRQYVRFENYCNVPN